MDKLNITCGHLVSLSAGNGIIQHVIFKPSAASRSAIVEAVNGGSKPMFIIVDDVSGCHVSEHKHEFIRYRETYGTITLTTLEMT